MFFLVRTGFWFSLVVLMLPLDPAGSAGSVGPFQAFFAAREAVGDVAGICERKPEVCVVGKAAFQTITVRAREGARIASDMMESDAPVSAAPDSAITGSIVADAVAMPELAPLPRPRPSK